jgi:signal transduction histidine kinase
MLTDGLFFQLLPTWLSDQLRSLWDRDRDPYLDDLRWRLHLKLLLVTALFSLTLFMLNLTRGVVDDIGLAVVISLASWGWLRTHPQHSRVLVRVVVTTFTLLALRTIYFDASPGVHWALLVMMAFPVFATSLDGMVSGALVALVVALTGFLGIATGHTGGLYVIVVAFASLAAICFYFTCLAHTWMFNNLVARQRESVSAIAFTKAIAEQLAVTLNKDVAVANAHLRASLSRGLAGLEQARELQQILAHARAKLPGDLPRAAIVPSDLLETLRHSVLRTFLGLALIVALLATAIILLLRMPLWELSSLVATVTAMLLWLGDQSSPRWHWRLYVFLAATLGSMALDIFYSTHSPPAGSLVFLPLIVFFAGMLAKPTVSVITAVVSVALLFWSYSQVQDTSGMGVVLVVLALLVALIVGLSHLIASAYHNLLNAMLVEEDGLRHSLGAYRRMVSTLFHDLANPLAVLQTLAALPPSLLTQEDEARAARMMQRLDDVANSARQAAMPGVGPVSSMALVADQLLDLFRDKLREKQQRFELSNGADLMLKRGGGLLRDLMLGHLLSNAIKYAPNGDVISLSARAQDAWIILTLRDHGPGYPLDVLHDIANGLSPLVRPGTLGEMGNGYGLLEASASARELGGHLTLRKHPDGGAEAELWLPEGQLES